MYFHNQIKGEWDGKAREFFLEEVAYRFPCPCDRSNDWQYLDDFLPQRSCLCSEGEKL